ncbi:MAG: alpha/beta fold hydrolase [Bacteroidota bacterium]|nr:alpha/beta fold hydrolase [Bacteroidota bacterium]
MKLHYKQYGTAGTDLIILHGLFGSLDNWHTLATRFSEQFRVWVPDQRNHGKSPHDEVSNYEVMTADLLEFMDKHNLESAHILGHSMGGKTAMQFALHHPDRVEKLIIADIAPKAYPLRHDEILEALQALDLSKVERRGDAEEMLGKSIQSTAVVLFLLKNLARKDTGFAWKMNLDALSAHYEEISGVVSGPHIFEGQALFMKGERSNYIRQEDEQEILKLFPKTRFVTLADAGHWLHAESPEIFHDTVVEFLA